MDTPTAPTLRPPVVYEDGPHASAVAANLAKTVGIQRVTCPACGATVLAMVGLAWYKPAKTWKQRHGFSTQRCACGRAYVGWLA